MKKRKPTFESDRAKSKLIRGLSSKARLTEAEIVNDDFSNLLDTLDEVTDAVHELEWQMKTIKNYTDNIGGSSSPLQYLKKIMATLKDVKRSADNVKKEADQALKDIQPMTRRTI